MSDGGQALLQEIVHVSWLEIRVETPTLTTELKLDAITFRVHECFRACWLGSFPML